MILERQMTVKIGRKHTQYGVHVIQTLHQINMTMKTMDVSGCFQSVNDQTAIILQCLFLSRI